ncbi:MAG: arginine deiminase family protein [Nanoarchaeota archaeon]
MHAIVRKPGHNFAGGITTSNLGTQDYNKALKQHEDYCKVLESCGIKVFVLDADLKYPDGCFVEDTAIVTEQYAIITRLGHSTRQGEEEKIVEILSNYRKIVYIQSPATLDGGDILRVDKHFYIGLSKRTNREGAKQLTTILSKEGYTASTVPVKTVLHLKTGVTSIGMNNLLCIEEFQKRPEFKSFNVIPISKDEEYSANCLVVKEWLLMPKGFTRTRSKLKGLGYNITEIEMGEFAKMDGGLTCLSLLFS